MVITVVSQSRDPTLPVTAFLTKVTVIVHEDDFMKKPGGRAVQDTVHRPQQGRQSFIVETNNNTSNGQIRWVRLVFTSVR